jgi:hypothetical protein
MTTDDGRQTTVFDDHRPWTIDHGDAYLDVRRWVNTVLALDSWLYEGPQTTVDRPQKMTIDHGRLTM